MITENWEQFYAERDPAVCWEITENKIRARLNRLCPQKEFKVKEIKDPWISNEILEEIKDKDRLLFTARRTKKEEDWVLARQARNRVGCMIVQARADFLRVQARADFLRAAKRPGGGPEKVLEIDQNNSTREKDGNW